MPFLWLFALAVLAGCASTKVVSRQPYTGERIARPDRIIVHDFAATPADVPAGSAVASEYSAPSTPMTPERIATGRKLGPARDLVRASGTALSQRNSRIEDRAGRRACGHVGH